MRKHVYSWYKEEPHSGKANWYKNGTCLCQECKDASSRQARIYRLRRKMASLRT